jgi:hypothetical protein
MQVLSKQYCKLGSKLPVWHLTPWAPCHRTALTDLFPDIWTLQVQSSENRSISWPQSRTRHLAAQDGNLVAEHDDLDGQVPLPATEETTQLEQTDEGDIEDGERHTPSSSSSPRHRKVQVDWSG